MVDNGNRDARRAGTLFVCGTPIGNLEDITFRAVRILKEADIIAAEDTRRTLKLCNYYSIDTPLVSYHQHNENERTQMLVERLLAGESVALVTDAGMPCISDPGAVLVERARGAGIKVIPVPGPDAITTALAVSGLPADSYVFGGFLPAKACDRRKTLTRLRYQPRTLVFFETPHRLVAGLEAILDVCGDRQAIVARELTKLHEEVLAGNLSEVICQLKGRPKIKGEFVVLVTGAADQQPSAEGCTEADILDNIRKLMKKGITKKEAIKVCADLHGLPKRDVYKIATEINAPLPYTRQCK